MASRPPNTVRHSQDMSRGLGPMSVWEGLL